MAFGVHSPRRLGSKERSLTPCLRHQRRQTGLDWLADFSWFFYWEKWLPADVPAIAITIGWQTSAVTIEITCIFCQFFWYLEGTRRVSAFILTVPCGITLSFGTFWNERNVLEISQWSAAMSCICNKCTQPKLDNRRWRLYASISSKLYSKPSNVAVEIQNYPSRVDHFHWNPWIFHSFSISFL